MAGDGRRSRRSVAGRAVHQANPSHWGDTLEIKRLTWLIIVAILAVGIVTDSGMPAQEIPEASPAAVPSTTLYFPLIPIAPYQWQPSGYGRAGVSAGPDYLLHGRSMWSYTWGMGNCLYDVPMVFDGHDLPSAERLRDCGVLAPALLLFNEPEWVSQGNTSPAEGAAALRYIEDNWPGEIWCCGNLVSHPGWLNRMLEAYRAEYNTMPRITGFALHVYVNDGTPVANPDDPFWLNSSQVQLATYLTAIREWGLPDRIIVTECCLLGAYGPDVYQRNMDAYMTWLRSVPEVESVAWFSSRYFGFPDADLLTSSWDLTPVGEQWMDWRWQ